MPKPLPIRIPSHTAPTHRLRMTLRRAEQLARTTITPWAAIDHLHRRFGTLRRSRYTCDDLRRIRAEPINFLGEPRR